MADPIINRSPVVGSSLLVSYGYCREHRILEVELRGGRIYRYFMVVSSVVEELEREPSKGRYFNEAIKDRFPFKELAPELDNDLSAQLERSLKR